MTLRYTFKGEQHTATEADIQGRAIGFIVLKNGLILKHIENDEYEVVRL